MAVFGRRSARQRLRSAARESLVIPAFSAPVDCTAWVLDGLWPAELATVSPQTASLARYLSTDLHRIASSANEQLQAVGRSGLTGAARQAAETRVINVARAFAVLRVESTVRQLHNESLEFPTQYLGLSPAQATDHESAPAPPPAAAPPPRPRHRQAAPAAVRDVEVLSAPRRPGPDRSAEPTVIDPVDPIDETAPSVQPGEMAEPESALEADSGPGPTEQRLRRLLAFVARQEPGVRWAAGTRADDTVVLTTDIAHGWIPPGVDLPADVTLVEPGWRDGSARALLGEMTTSQSYAPGDRIGCNSETGAVAVSAAPRTLPMTDDLGWQLAEATHWRDGLPRIVNTLAKAGAAGTGVVDAEVDLLRVHLDTARYQLLAQYPDPDRALLLNCLLLAATDRIATGDVLGANYHFRWFQTLSDPPAGGWGRLGR